MVPAFRNQENEVQTSISKQCLASTQTQGKLSFEFSLIRDAIYEASADWLIVYKIPATTRVVTTFFNLLTLRGM